MHGSGGGWVAYGGSGWRGWVLSRPVEQLSHVVWYSGSNDADTERGKRMMRRVLLVCRLRQAET